jgi:hypothetical protein
VAGLIFMTPGVPGRAPPPRRGAARAAKYPDQKPRNPASRSAVRHSGAK